MSNVKILVFPKDPNPYQEMLYSHTKDITIKYLDPNTMDTRFLHRVLEFIKTLIESRKQGFSIFHIHWLYPFFIGSGFINSCISTIYLLTILIVLKLLSYKIVWTVHNILPHEKTFINDVWVTKLFAIFLTSAIANSEHTKQELEKLGISIKNISVIPIGSFVGYYKKNDKNKARKIVGIPENHTVISFVGMIRKYKGVDHLYKAFSYVLQNYSNVTCILAGKPHNDIAQQMKDFVSLDKKRMIVIDRTLEKDELETILSASDLFLFPAVKITTSSSVLLAFTFGVPVIGPRIGNLKDFKNDIGYWYSDPLSFKQIQEQIEIVLKDKKQAQTKGEKAIAFAQSISWSKIAKQLEDFYLHV